MDNYFALHWKFICWVTETLKEIFETEMVIMNLRYALEKKKSFWLYDMAYPCIYSSIILLKLQGEFFVQKGKWVQVLLVYALGYSLSRTSHYSLGEQTCKFWLLIKMERINDHIIIWEMYRVYLLHVYLQNV